MTDVPSPNIGPPFKRTQIRLHNPFRRLLRAFKASLRTEKQLRDFVQGTMSLFWQRQSMYVSAGLLAGYYYDVRMAILCVMLCQVTEMVDVFISVRLLRWDRIPKRKLQDYHLLLLVSSVASAFAVAFFAFSIARMEGPTIHFAPMFFLFAAGLFAAVNNHQLPFVLYARILIYGFVFLSIPILDLVATQAPFHSELWMQFLTILFVLYFVIDCSRIFLQMYQRNLDQLEDLRAERDRAHAALEVKSQFVSTVSHELRTPLTSIQGTLDMLQSGVFDDQAERRTKLVKLAHKNSKRLTDLINDILDVQKLESGQMGFDMKPLRYLDCLKDSIIAVSGMADSKQVDLVAGTLDADLYIEGDHSRLVQVITNVLSNAVKFSDGAERVEISLMTHGDQARLSIRDFGIGIPDNAHATVFGRFNQIDSSDHRRFEGTGLGMNISHDIIKAHDGQLHYESVLGEGTDFYIDIPLSSTID